MVLFADFQHNIFSFVVNFQSIFTAAYSLKARYKKFEQLKQKNVTGWCRQSHRAYSVLEALLGINLSVNKAIFKIPKLLWERVVLVTELHVCSLCSC